MGYTENRMKETTEPQEGISWKNIVIFWITSSCFLLFLCYLSFQNDKEKKDYKIMNEQSQMEDLENRVKKLEENSVN